MAGVLAGPATSAPPSTERLVGTGVRCHVCDVLWLYDERLRLMLMLDGPQYPNWDQDATAIADEYAKQDPAVVAAGLREAADVIGAAVRGAVRDQWQRTGSRSDGARFTVESFARYFIHDRFTISTTSPASGTLNPSSLTPCLPMFSLA